MCCSRSRHSHAHHYSQVTATGGAKFAIDYVLTVPPRPVPPWLAQWLPSGLSPMGLLGWIAGAVCVITLLRTFIHLWGRWYATKSVNLVQADMRRRVFEHTLHLPLHRVQALKSGGATSLIREDAGGVADLIFNMLYNPWQAIIQLLGSLFVLVLVDWRLMLGGLLLLPVVWMTHRTWIHRVRPLFKDIRSRRQQNRCGHHRDLRRYSRGPHLCRDKSE
ncbi:MAG: ABC transporter ATP-binding protein [Pirellulaceae bacterium]